LSAETPLISVVIPAHREAVGIQALIERIATVLRSLPVEHEIIVVDDGSPDETFERVRELAAVNSAVRGLKLARNFGKEAALLAGLRMAKGDAIVTMDADLQHPPDLIPHMISAWHGGAKIVHGVKRNRQAEGLVARLRSRTFSHLVAALGGIELRNSSDFKLLDRAAADVLARHLPERARFYRGLAEWIGLRQEAVFFDVGTRHSGQTKWSTRALLGVARVALVSFTSTPLRIISWLGVLVMIVGVALGADALWSWFNGRSVSGFVTILATLLFIGSVIMVSLGIIGEYIAAIYDEVKGRPAYVIEKHCGNQSGES
jgi:glycosyltransferase involved in cell wall biosynthesis